MKKASVLLLVASLLWGVSAFASAQTDDQSVKTKQIVKTTRALSKKEKMMPAPDVQLKRLAEGLNLTDEQQKQIRPVLEDEYARLKEIRQNEELSPKQIQKKVEELRTETIAKMQAFMTPEQKKTHDLISTEIKANKQKRIKENRKARIGTKSDPPERVRP
jgi:Spy/CpxP family protein refolding chaperone